MALRIAQAGNPLLWLTVGGNSDDILESATEIAETTRLLAESVKSSLNFDKLVNYALGIASKLKKNEPTMITV